MVAESANAERRRHQRHAYPCLRRVAPYDGFSFPKDDEFCEIRCRDLSAAGISFLIQDRPPSGLLAVDLGGPPGSSCLVAARVVHCQGMTGDEGGWRLVGCAFVKRLR